jgi:hypothetical protein
MSGLQEAKKNAIDFLLKSIEEPYHAIPNDNDPLGFEAHLYLAHRGLISKSEWAEKIKKIWDDWIEDREGPPIYDNEERLLNPGRRYFWPSIEKHAFDGVDPDSVIWEPGFDIENHLAMFRTKEVFHLPGYSDCFRRAKRELDMKLSPLPDISRSGEDHRLLWQIMRSPFLRSVLKDSLRGVAGRFMDAEVAIGTMVPVFGPKAEVYLPITPADIFFLLVTNLEARYFDQAKLYLDRDFQRQKRDGSFDDDVIETCLNLCSISLSGIDPNGDITNPAISWLIGKQREDGKWQYLGIEDIINTDEIKREDVFLTVFVLETLDLIANDKPLPIWATNTAPTRPSLKAFQGLGPLLSVPEGMKWGDVSITFISEEAVEIRAKRPLGVKNFIELGFKDRRGSKPDTKWVILKALARSQGSISWKDKTASPTWKPHIKALRKRLRDIFKIDDDPFFPYRRTSSYKAKFTISRREEN